MQVKQIRIIDFIGASQAQFVVPVYQRVYSWRRPQLRELWEDILGAGRLDKPHFMGNVFYVEEESAHCGTRQLDVIDGQQRLTTVTLLMCAVRDHLAELQAQSPQSKGETMFDGLDAEGVEDSFLKVDLEGEAECKLVLSRADAPTLRWLEGVGGRPETDEERSKLVVDSYEWFKARLAAEGFDDEAFENGIRQFYIVAVQMEADDRPQTVFESLNSRGLPLSTPDLVRNHLLMHSEFDPKSYLYDTYWTEVEDAFASDSDDRYLAHAIRTWTGAGSSVKDDRGIFDAFKSSFAVKGADELEKRTAGLAAYCLGFHEKVAAGDEATLAACREWEENRGKAERLRNDRKTFGD